MALENYPFYEDLSEDVQNFLKMRLQPIEVPKDTILFFQGDVCDSVLFLESGEVRLYTQDNAGKEKTLYTLQAGEQCIINTASTLSQTKAIATAVSTTEIKGYIMDMYSIKDFARMSESYQNYLFSLYSLECAPLLHTTDDTLSTIDADVWNWLNEQGSKKVCASYETIAQELGTNAAVVEKVLKSLENDKALKLHDDCIELV